MYYVSLAVFTWLVSPLLIDWKQLPRLLPYAFVGGFLNGLMDHIGEMTGWWHYQDSWPLPSHEMITVLIHFSAAPVTAMLFAQGLRPSERLPWLHTLAERPWLYIIAFSLACMGPEVLAGQIGRIAYLPPWNPYVSFAIYLVQWWGVYELERWWQRTGVT